MNERFVTGATLSASVVHYNYNYNYNYNYKPERMLQLTRATAVPAPINQSPLNLLSRAASAVTVESLSLSSPPAPVPRNTVVVHRRLDQHRSQHSRWHGRHHLQQHHPSFIFPPAAFSMAPDAVASFSTATATATATATNPISSLSKIATPPKILAVFPQFSPLPSAYSLPMPPGIEITLPRSHSHSFAPHDAKGRGGGCENSHQTPTAKRGIGNASIQRTPTKGAAAAAHSTKYKMNYHCVSMRRWEAVRYIEELAKGSNDYRHHRSWTTTHGAVRGGRVRPGSISMSMPMRALSTGSCPIPTQAAKATSY